MKHREYMISRITWGLFIEIEVWSEVSEEKYLHSHTLLKSNFGAHIDE